MGHPGYRWTLAPEGLAWRWRAVDRDQETVFLEGLASSKAEAAAYLARSLVMGVLSDAEEAAA